jgi:hypothetical protein
VRRPAHDIEGAFERSFADGRVGDEQRRRAAGLSMCQVYAASSGSNGTMLHKQLEPQKFKEIKTSKKLPFEPFFYRFFIVYWGPQTKRIINQFTNVFKRLKVKTVGALSTTRAVHKLSI